MAAAKTNSGFRSSLASLEGDKVVWMILFILIMLSILALSSSTPLLAIQEKTNRMTIALEQVIVSLVGLGLIWLIYKYVDVGPLRWISKWMFVISLIPLLFLTLHLNIGFARAARINGAWRAIKVFGFQVQVFEFVKVFMVLYLSWAMNELKHGKTEMAKRLAAKYPRLKWLSTDFGKCLFYVLVPMGITILLEMRGSNSSAAILAIVMTVTVIIGGIKTKYVCGLVVSVALAVGLLFVVQKVTGWEFLGRKMEAVSRVADFKDDPIMRIRSVEKGSPEYYKVLDKVRQPMSAKVAVRDGGLIGKGIGKSTQRYKTAVMYEDYMYSFIIEEYGLLGGIFVLMLYGSLLARGSLIVKSCDNLFAQTAVGGMVSLISGQAMLHIFVNARLMPLTGQNLPIVSHGISSFLAFSIAFGVILSISRMARKKMEKERAEAEPIIVTDDDLRDRLADLDAIE
ncbi:MAG: FtsW/RodA/SpoVE family cell cycle protein [Candidatus Cryptobacteroides sp.]